MGWKKVSGGKISNDALVEVVVLTRELFGGKKQGGPNKAISDIISGRPSEGV